jgi:hypothetical protein
MGIENSGVAGSHGDTHFSLHFEDLMARLDEGLLQPMNLLGNVFRVDPIRWNAIGGFSDDQYFAMTNPRRYRNTSIDLLSRRVRHTQ